MASKFLVNGKYQARAGVFSAIKSAVKNPSSPNSSGNILIIDDGIGAGFGGGSGVNGFFKQGADAVYSFDDINLFQSFVKGGELWNLAKPLFKPSGDQKGVSKVFYIKAAATAPATMTFSFTNGGFAIKTKDEGVNANGVLSGSTLSQGIGGQLLKAASGKYFLQILHGSYKGLDAVNNTPYDGVLAANSTPQVLISSPECVSVQDLITWMQNSVDFNAGFALQTGFTDTGALTDADVADGLILATGGTETFGTADLDAAISKINNLDFVHILSMQANGTATGANNVKLQNFIQNTSKYDRVLVVAGGQTKADRSVSKAAAAFFNSQSVIVIHGGVKKTSRGVNGFNVYSSLYHAAAVLGRCAGLPSQVPVTSKSLGIDGLVDPLEDQDQEDLIAAGVVGSFYDTEVKSFVVGLDVDTLQSNDFLINNDGTTYCWQLRRIEAELNKDIVVSGKLRFFDPNGLSGNRNTISEEEVTVWAINKLKERTATDKKDDLIILAKNVVASINQDQIQLSYDFVPNTEVKDIISTGTMVTA